MMDFGYGVKDTYTANFEVTSRPTKAKLRHITPELQGEL